MPPDLLRYFEMRLTGKLRRHILLGYYYCILFNNIMLFKVSKR